MLRKFQEIQRAFHVDVMRGDRGELRPGRQQGCKMKDAIDLELGQDAIQQARVGNRSGEDATDQRHERWIERMNVERHDRCAGRAQAGHETVADLTASSRDQDNGLAHVTQT